MAEKEDEMDQQALMQQAQEARQEAATLSAELSDIDDKARRDREDFRLQRGGLAERGETEQIRAVFEEEKTRMAELAERRRILPFEIYAAQVRAVEAEIKVHEDRIATAEQERAGLSEKASAAKEVLDEAQREYDKHNNAAGWHQSTIDSNAMKVADKRAELKALLEAGPADMSAPPMIPAGYGVARGV